MIIPVILSGGAGTRLWPVSREGHPKPFMKLADGESLLQKTYQRALAVVGRFNDQSDTAGEILTITNRDYYFISKDEWALANGGGKNQAGFLLEPFGRNTAPAIALAAHYVRAKYGSAARMLILPSDHLIHDQAAFLQSLSVADAEDLGTHLLTFGIVPHAAETGFGYIKVAQKINAADPPKTHSVQAFVEKPDQLTAEQYVASGQYLWNSGMFYFNAETILQELAKHAPALSDTAKQCWQAMVEKMPAALNLGSSSMMEIDEKSFKAIPDISIDYAVMEKSTQVSVVPASFDWSDIGSWSAVCQLADANAEGNRAMLAPGGEAIFVGGNNNYVQAEDRVVATVGVSDLIIIDTPDALLVAHHDHAQDVKKVVAQLKARNHDTHKVHRTVRRPWGTYTVLEEGVGFKIKRIEVKPGASLSLQMHHHRSEHWIVVSGMAKVINGEREIFVNTNESTYIPAGHHHRLTNPGILDLVMIEVQSGAYLGEDDIVRFNDQYGRV